MGFAFAYPSGQGRRARTSFTYNGTGKVLTTTDPMGMVTLNGYDGAGNLNSTTRDFGTGRLNQLTTRVYGAVGDIVLTTDPNGNVTATTYDAARRLTTLTAPPAPAAPNGVITTFSYDADGRVIGTQQSANGTVLRTTSASYTLTGKPATATDANGNVTHYAYDAVDRLSSVTDAMGRLTGYAYDALGRRTAVSNPAIQAAPLLQQSYTPDGLVASLTDANSHATSFTPDGFNRLSTTTYPNSSAEVLGYDADNNVLTRKTRAGATITFSYDTLNRLSSKTPPSPAPVVTYSYDLASHLIAVSDTSAAIAAPSGSSASYATSIGYDLLNRPVTVSWTPATAQTTPTASSATFSYGYDATNRRISQSVTDSSWWNYPTSATNVSYTANNLNQYTAVGAVTPTYDNNGNLTFDGTFTYCYDAENRQTKIIQGGTCASPTTTIASYAYDAQGRRKSKTVGGSTTIYVTDADNREVLEYNGTGGAVQNWYSFALGSDDVLNQMNVGAGTRATFVLDVQGSVVGSLNSGGALTKIGYQTYGENPSLTSGTYRYTGRRFDAETAGSASQPSGLYYYRARKYSPTLGRFMQPDPIGTKGGTNLYVYVEDDPLNLVDPYGNCPQCVVAAAVLARPLLLAIGAGIAYYGSRAVNDTVRILSDVLYIKPPANAWDPNGPKAPGYPGGQSGYQDPKGGPNWVPNPNGPGYGWEAQSGKVWVPTGPGGAAHGGPHWDVQDPRNPGDYTNVYPPKASTEGTSEFIVPELLSQNASQISLPQNTSQPIEQQSGK